MNSQIRTILNSKSKSLLPCSSTAKSRCLFWSSQKLVHTTYPKHVCHVSRVINHNLCHNILSRHNVHFLAKSKWRLTIGFHQSFHHTPSHYEKKTRSMPRLLYVQNPFTWLINKLDFQMLKRAWDPQFDEKEFQRGTKQAVATITKFVSQNMFVNLKGLLTKHALATLQHDVETKWTDEQRRLIGLDPEDIQLAIPRRIHFQRIVAQKFCDVDMVLIAMKWMEHGGANAIIFVEVMSRFHREYTEGQFPDWTVSLFRVTRFNILPR